MSADREISFDSFDPFGDIDINDSAEDFEEFERDGSFSLIKCIYASFQLSVMCGILFGLFATFLWWIELNVNGYCSEALDNIPKQLRHTKLFVMPVRFLLIMFWPLLTVAPICSWSMIKKSNILFWCTIAGLVDVIDRLYFYIFEHYKTHWRSYVGNVIFLMIWFVVFYKFVRHRLLQSGKNYNAVKITLKITLQITLGLAMSIPYNYVFLPFYQGSTTLIKLALSCSLITVLYAPKLIISQVIINLHGVYEPNEGIVFAVVVLVMSTMVTRLSQATIDSLTYFIIVSLVHGIFNVLDKVTTNARTKFFNWICKRSNNHMNERNEYVTHYIAHQSLISIITETSSVILSNAAAYLLAYYYKSEGYNGWYLSRDMLIRSSIAVCIEWTFNVVSLKIQCDQNIPVLGIWKREWRLILVIHLIPVIYVVIYFAPYVDASLLHDALPNSTSQCAGLFRRL